MKIPRLRQLTTVYTINDTAAFEEENKRIFDNFKKSDGLPWAITAVSRGHELHRLALIEEAHDEQRYDLLDEIFGMIDPDKTSSIHDLDGYNAEQQD